MQNSDRQGKVTTSIMYCIGHVWMAYVGHNIEAEELRMDSPLWTGKLGVWRIAHG